MRNEYFFGFILGTTFGIFFESIFNFGYTFSILCALATVTTSLIYKKGARVTWGFVVSLCLLGCALGVLRVDVSQGSGNVHTLDKLLGGTAQLEGIVVSEPDVRENYTNVVFKTRSVLYDPADVLLRVPVYPEIKYGDQLMVVGKVATPKNFANDNTGRIFDYRAYLAKDGIYYEMYFPKVLVTDHNKGNIIKEKLFTFKSWLMGNITRMIPEPEASLGGGITLGTKQSLGADLIQMFRETGLAHIVVLSGYNIAVVAVVISLAFSFLPFTIRLLATSLGIILFAIMVGAEATVMRATLMALVVILARLIGREGSALRALLFVGFIMVLLNPMILLHDVSFQLSFMATLSLCLLVPVLEKYFLWIQEKTIREILITTIATQIFVAPILLYQMGSVSLIGVVANLFVLPFVPLAMLLVALVAFFAWVPLLASLVALGAQLLLSYILFIAKVGSTIPFSSVHIQSFGIAALVISYAIIFTWCLRAEKNATQRD